MIGYNIPFLMKKELVEWVGIFTFSLFGILMIKDGYYMESKLVEEEYLEEEENLKHKQIEAHSHSNRKNNTHDSNQYNKAKNNIKEEVYNISNENDLNEKLLNKNSVDLENNKLKNGKINFFDSFWAFGFTLIMAELGDKSQIAAIVIGATQNFYGVLLGTSLGHSLCTVIAIVFGNIFSKYVTTKQITIIGGTIFLIFAMLFLIGKIY